VSDPRVKKHLNLFHEEHGETRSEMVSEEKSREKGKLKTAPIGVGKHSMAYVSGVTKWRAMT